MTQKMIRVTKEEFFSTVGQMNVHPRPERKVTYWELSGHKLVGITTPGYLCEGERTYSVSEEVHNGKRS